LIEPNESIWFGYALLYEQYGAKDAAIEAYRKVEKPEGIPPAFETWQLAQARLKALGAVVQ
jgi:DNA-binding SARP family transcriptional activator